jgi:hypothetical protein
VKKFLMRLWIVISIPWISFIAYIGFSEPNAVHGGPWLFLLLMGILPISFIAALFWAIMGLKK